MDRARAPGEGRKRRMTRQLEVKFKNVREIRMGSPYRLCEIEFTGKWIPPLPAEDWQDLAARSPDGRYLALIRWNTEGNTPGFHVIRIDTKKKVYHKTKRILGLCREITWEKGKFVWTT